MRTPSPQCRSSALDRCSTIFCIIPPNVFDNIARRGDDQQRSWALDTLQRDHSLRTARLQNTLVGVPPQQAAYSLRFAAAPALGQVQRTIFDMHGSEADADL